MEDGTTFENPNAWREASEFGPAIWGGSIAWKKYSLQRTLLVFPDILSVLTVFPRWELTALMVTYQAIALGSHRNI